MLERLKRRKAARNAHRPQEPAQVPRVLVLADYPGLEELLDAGDIAGATGLVAARGHLSPDELAGVNLQLRNEAFVRAARQGPVDRQWPPQTQADTDLTGELPEVSAEQLDRDTLVAGVRGHGALIVRGLFPDSVCRQLRAMTDETMAAFERDREAVDPAWNTPLTDVSGRLLGAEHFRAWNHGASGLSAADSPRSATFVIDSFARLGITELVASYLGERPGVTLEKWTMRRVPPDVKASWHQDGAFLGTDKHTINLWVALSDCGERASGLDILPRRFDRIVATGTPGAVFEWDVSPDVVEQERGDTEIASPVFRAGDAIFFDQFLLHKTGTRDDLTEERYALETWFFPPSSYPENYNGLLL